MSDEISVIEKALSLWTELTGYEPDRFQVRLADEWSLRDMGQSIREALELDTTNVTGAMLLSYFTRKYLDGKAWSANEILGNYDQVAAYLKNAHELYRLLDDPEIVDPIKEYQHRLIATLDAYGLASEEVVELVNNVDSIAFLRRDALRAMEKLQIYQFLQGESDPQPAKYSQTVYAFYNVNSLIKTMAGQPGGGISLALIKTPDDFHQYFVFVVRNGGTLSIVTDKPRWCHPLQGEMLSSRGRSVMRDFSTRASKNWFPYQFCKFEEIKDDAGVTQALRFAQGWEVKDMVNYQSQLFPVGKLCDMSAPQIVWTVLMLDLINNKFWAQQHRTKELCYTGEMVKVQNALIDAPEAKALAVTGYKPLVAPELTADDVTHEKVVEDWDRRPSNGNRWLEERYLDRVNKGDVLNLLSSDRQQVKYLTQDGKGLQVISKTALERESSWSMEKRPKKYQMQCLDPEFFGTEEEILKNQRWVARHNLAKLIQIEADKEFEKRQASVMAWYQAKVTANLENLCRAAKRGQFEGFNFYDQDFYSRRLKDGFKNDAFYFSEDRCLRDIDSYKSTKFDQGYKTGGGHRCYYTGAVSSNTIQFYPTSAEGIAKICGCTVQDLPDVLQHWMREKRYNGNPNLDNLDPMDWILKDPWSKLELKVTIYLSKRGLARV